MQIRPSRLPSTAALTAFECAARTSSFSRAARDLNTSQSAISRHIADLEIRLGTRLFHRERRAVRLTEQGEYLFGAVKSGLDTIRNATEALSLWPDHQQITIACTHEISHLFIMPRFDQLRAAAGEGADVRIMTYEYDMLEQAIDPRIDIVLTYDADYAQAVEKPIIAPEVIQPVCAPSFAKAHQMVLSHEPGNWTSLPFLRLSKPNRGWATWEDWFERVGVTTLPQSFLDFENYVYLLEAAAAGKGIALGWSGLVDRHLATDALVCLSESGEAFEHALYAALTKRGQEHSVARNCVNALVIA